MYDIGIIGGGPAGYVAAEKAGQQGLSVILFESNDLGGVCLNEGCIPVKTYLFSAKLLDYARHGEKYGLKTTGAEVDFQVMMSRKDRIVKKLVAAVENRMKRHKVELVKAAAAILENRNGIVTLQSGDRKTECRNILICTGSEVAVPPVKGLKETHYLTSREALQINEIPSSLAIIGGGVIGLEFANLFNSLGAKVIVIEMMDEILPGTDTEISQLLRKEFTKRGVEFHLKARVTEAKEKGIVLEKGDEKLEIIADKILISTGRKPVIQGFGLEKLGVELFRGGIKIDEHCRTNIPNVYAAGDVTGFSMLAHTASREGEVAVNHITGRPDRMRYKAIPGVVYTNPEVAVVGLTEKEAGEKGIDIEVQKLPMTYAGRFVAENDLFQGLCKIVVGKKYREVLGVHMIGKPASEMIFGAAMAIEAQLTVNELKEIVFPHPTVSEIFREGAFMF
ncbi:MAG: dihydrolipoyl dehydrogenase [Bacteroidales bacterium]|nr:dihydrolipoyl dehydrogenase [Bacteroidales bacterium]